MSEVGQKMLTAQVGKVSTQVLRKRVKLARYNKSKKIVKIN